MKEELDDLLCKRYPEIFRDRNKAPTQTCMCWGFAHEDGWFRIIDSLCAYIQGRCNNANKTLGFKKEWHAEWKAKHPSKKDEDSPHWPLENACPQVVCDQVKEKFGTLRFYYHGGDHHVSGAVGFAEHLSSVTCEFCGETDPKIVGTTTKGWIKTCCRKCIPKLLTARTVKETSWVSLAFLQRKCDRKSRSKKV